MTKGIQTVAITHSDPTYTRDLGEGLRLRWSQQADGARIGNLYSTVFRRDKDDVPNNGIHHWTNELISGNHPLIGSNDFAIVEDTATGIVVASTCLMQAEWNYDGIRFPVGRPEIVASLPEYRNRGLIRAIFELIHARSEQRGDVAQGITGIPYYYRQFGYEYAFDLGGSKSIRFSDVPQLKAEESEPYTLRYATEADIPTLQRLYQRECQRQHGGAPLLVSAEIPAAYWQYTQGWRELASGEGWRAKLLCDQAGKVLGYTLLTSMRWGNSVHVRAMMFDAGVSLPAVLPAMLRGIQAETPTLLKRRPEMPEADRITLNLGREHPVYQALSGKLGGDEPPYAWYVRVADLPGLLRRLAPVLEARLAASLMGNYSGELRLNFFRGGLRLVFEAGKLALTEPWQVDHNWGPKPQAEFPPLVFLRLLFGHDSLAELSAFLPDVSADDEAKMLLDTLFPKRVSWVINLD